MPTMTADAPEMYRENSSMPGVPQGLTLFAELRKLSPAMRLGLASPPSAASS